MMNIKIRNMKDKIEINSFIYCIGENGVFSGIFIEKEANTGSQIIESYVNGKITKKLEYKKISTNNNSYKMFLVKSMVLFLRWTIGRKQHHLKEVHIRCIVKTLAITILLKKICLHTIRQD